MKLLKYIPLLAGLLATSMASAAPVPVDLKAGQWKAQFFDASGKMMFDAGVCIQKEGTWFMTTQSYTAGHWLLVGNNIRLHGSNVNSNGAGELVRATPQFMSGPWQSWTDDDTINMNLVSKWMFTKVLCDPPAPPEV